MSADLTPKGIKNNAVRPPSFWRRFGLQFGIWSVGIVMWLSFVALAPGAFTHKDIYLAFAASTPQFALMAIPLTLIVITGEIDLSFPSIMALSTCAFSECANNGISIWVSLIIGIAVGCVCGWFNGFLITKFAIPSLVITIGTQFLYAGIDLAWTNGSGVAFTDSKYNTINKLLVGNGFLNIPNQFWWTIIAAVVLWFVLNRTKFGAHIFLTGDNKTSAQLMGVNVKRVKIVTFVIMGGFSAIAGLVASFQVSYFWPTLGSGLLLNSIAAVFLGGTSVFGGTGSITGSFVGAFIIGAINAGIVASGVNAFYTQVFFGVVIVVSVLLQAIISRRIKN